MRLLSKRSFLSSLAATFIASLLFALPGHPACAEDDPSESPKAPLGSTPQQIAALYGPVLRHNARVRRHQILEGGTAIDGDLYSRNGLVVRVVYHAGVAVLLEYTRVAGPLTIPDANLLLAANASTAAWEPGKENTETNRFFRRSDNKAVAHYAAEYDGSLLIAAETTSNNLCGDRIMDTH